MTDQPDAPDPGDFCHGPADAPFKPGLALHRWAPVQVIRSSPISGSDPNLAVVEVCPSCRQWRAVTYTRAEQPLPPESQG
jgi:hypothetical protein